ncbi:MAG: hypothetical protein M1812_001537 [Candelaria pacifica]|nr:MAG: hypothetical protein M1812_001537 [Candelaria pacifica]
MASQTTKDILMKVRKMVPPMLEKFHKGKIIDKWAELQSLEVVKSRFALTAYGIKQQLIRPSSYTGAPYFSAMASARLGADMSHIICEPEAAQVIKTYSPNIMVHPYMRQSHHLHEKETLESISQVVIDMLPRLHVIVIGPGLGRDKCMQETCAMVIQEARKVNMPFVLDADGLYLAQTRPELVQGYKECILTPNVVEFGRLAKSKGVDMSGDETQLCSNLSKAFGGVTIIQKGSKDYISNGEFTMVSDLEGGLKRSGGQGDTLTGSLATLLAWRRAYLDRIWDHENDLSASELLTLAAFGGSSVTRECSRLAFAERGRSLQAGDLTEKVEIAFNNLLDPAKSRL